MIKETRSKKKQIGRAMQTSVCSLCQNPVMQTWVAGIVHFTRVFQKPLKQLIETEMQHKANIPLH